jgi:ubiquitin-conjugating enzyme E2 G1
MIANTTAVSLLSTLLVDGILYSRFTVSADKKLIMSSLGGNFRCHLSFPPDYPHAPPSLVFKTPIPFHPNIYVDGKLCISILHPPGDDQYGYESANERWSPVQTPETILLSVISLLHSPNDESPANVEAATLWREEKKNSSKEFRKRCRKIVRESLGED